jgi:outer membrane protein OmpA-like peptidoglycan-associated protein
LKASTRLSSFALVVTAEPYCAISGPSDTVILENVTKSGTVGTISQVEIKYALAIRNSHQDAASGPIPVDPRLPLELVQARNAIRIAKMDDADRLAPEPMARAGTNLQNAEGFATSKADKKLVINSARQAVQAAEEARLVSIKRAQEERLTAERQAAAQREADEKAAREAAERKQQSEEAARLEAERRQQQEEIARLKAEADTQKAEADRRRAEADTQKAETARLQAELRTADETRAKQQAEQASRDAAAKEQAAQQDAERARAAAAELRASLLDQFNRVLPTRDTDRGLVVNMGDVLFDTGKYTLRQEAQIPLAKLSGIVVSHPGLRLDVEGHTDATGSDELNQKLSEQRAEAVDEFLSKQGVGGDSLTAKGFGKTRPVADNSTSKGRQQNRRVEIVVSGEVIGTKIGSQPTGAVNADQNEKQ